MAERGRKALPDVIMDRDKEGVAAALAIMPLLYMAWLLTWFGTFAGTCTGSDPKSLGAGMFYSALFYAAGIFCLRQSDLGPVGGILALPLVVLLLRQAAWAENWSSLSLWKGAALAPS